MAAIDRAIDNRTEDLLDELSQIRNQVNYLLGQVKEGDAMLPSDWPIMTGRAQRLFWEWRTLREHKNYGCGAR